MLYTTEQKTKLWGTEEFLGYFIHDSWVIGSHLSQCCLIAGFCGMTMGFCI